MTCPGDAELARAVSLGAAPELADHLAGCAACRDSVESSRRVIELARDLPVQLPSSARREEVRTALLAAGAGAGRRSLPAAWLAAGAAGAAAAGLVGYLALARAPAAVIAHRPHGTIHPHAGARYLTSSASPDEVVQLIDGTIDIEVEPLAPGERFRVAVGRAEVEVRGTAFTVTARAGQHTIELLEVAVAHGRVAVRPEVGAPVSLGAGQAWRAALATAVLSAAPVPPRAVADATAHPVAARQRLASGPASHPAAVAEPGAPQRQPALAVAPSVSQRRPAAAAVPSASQRNPAPAVVPSASQRSAAPAAVPLHLAAASPEPAPAPGPSASAPGPAARAPEELAYDQAWAALRSDDFVRAASGFTRVLLVAPDSPLVEDASYWRAVALARGRRSAEALSAFRDFLDGYARSPRAGEASAMLGWLLIDARDYDEAARRFRAAAGDPNPAVRTSAQAGLDALARRLR